MEPYGTYLGHEQDSACACLYLNVPVDVFKLRARDSNEVRKHAARSDGRWHNATGMRRQHAETAQKKGTDPRGADREDAQATQLLHPDAAASPSYAVAFRGATDDAGAPGNIVAA